MKGYLIDCGYMGYIPSKDEYCLFDTEEEYKTIFETEQNLAEETQPYFFIFVLKMKGENNVRSKRKLWRCKNIYGSCIGNSFKSSN